MEADKGDGEGGEGEVTVCVCFGFGFGPKKRNEVGKVQSKPFSIQIFSSLDKGKKLLMWSGWLGTHHYLLLLFYSVFNIFHVINKLLI